MTDGPARDERQHWAERSAAWAATTSPGRSLDDSFNRMMIAEAAIRPGEAVLDLGSGTGDPAISIALALDGAGSVTACDLTLDMLKAARGRAETVGLSVLRFVAGDMAGLPFADATFDCVTCRFGLMFVADRVAVAREALRVLRPGGRAAWLVWGPYEENPPFYVLRRAVAAFLGEDEGPPQGRHSMGAPGMVADVLRAAGYEAVDERELRYERPVDDLDDYVDRNLRRNYTERMKALGEDERRRLKQALFAAYEPFRKDGVVRMPNFARLGLGWKGGAG